MTRGLSSFADTATPKLGALCYYVRKLTKCHYCPRKVSLEMRETHSVNHLDCPGCPGYQEWERNKRWQTCKSYWVN